MVDKKKFGTAQISTLMTRFVLYITVELGMPHKKNVLDKNQQQIHSALFQQIKTRFTTQSAVHLHIYQRHNRARTPVTAKEAPRGTALLESALVVGEAGAVVGGSVIVGAWHTAHSA